MNEMKEDRTHVLKTVMGTREDQDKEMSSLGDRDIDTA